MEQVTWALFLIKAAGIYFFVCAGLHLFILLLIGFLCLYVHIKNVNELGPWQKEQIRRIAKDVA